MVETHLAMHRDEIWPAVQRCLCEVIGLPPERVRPRDSLVETFGIDSLDLMDVLLRLEETFGFEVEVDRIPRMVRAGERVRPDMNQVLDAEAVVRLRGLMPEAHDLVHEGMTWGELPSLISGETLVRLIAWQRAEVEPPVLPPESVGVAAE